MVLAVGQAPSRKAREGAHPQLFRFMLTKDKPGVYFPVKVAHPPKRCRAIAGKIKPEHAVRVVADYFEGAPPFSSAKHRNDIPDSFIWQTILDVAGTKKRVYVIAQDGELFKAAKKLSNATGYTSLDEFVESGDFQKAIEELTTETMARNIARAKRIFPKNESSLEALVQSDIVEALAGRKVRDSSIPDDNGDLRSDWGRWCEDLEFGVREDSNSRTWNPAESNQVCTAEILASDYHARSTDS